MAVLCQDNNEVAFLRHVRDDNKIALNCDRVVVLCQDKDKVALYWGNNAATLYQADNKATLYQSDNKTIV